MKASEINGVSFKFRKAQEFLAGPLQSGNSPMLEVQHIVDMCIFTMCLEYLVWETEGVDDCEQHT